MHAQAPNPAATDWAQIVALYQVLERLSPNPVITLNHAVAVAMVRGPRAGLDMLETLDGDDRVARHHRLEAVRAHLLEMAGDHAAALASFRIAARRRRAFRSGATLRPVPPGWRDCQSHCGQFLAETDASVVDEF